MNTTLLSSSLPKPSTENAYSFSFHTLKGHQPLPLSQFKGQVILVVNTASHCGFTPQYAGLEKLYQTYHSKGFVVIGVPSNDFGGQEPGTADEISSFCQINYGVTFPMTEKEVVKGKDAHPFFVWAREKLGFGSAPKWNFHKYLINRNGELVTYYYSTTKPESSKVEQAIQKALDEK